MGNIEVITNDIVTIHHDADGVLRDFHGYSEQLFFERYPQYEQYKVSSDKVRGWWFKDEYWPEEKGEEVDKIMTDLFFGGELTYEVFRHAPTLVTPEQWKTHIDELKAAFPNCRIIVSTHQYTMESKLGTIKWLDENIITYEDLIFTSEKELYGANYLLDDKPATVEKIHNIGNGCIPVMLKRERGNGWYRRDNKNIMFNMVDTIDEYRETIFAQERMKLKMKSMAYTV